MPTADLLDTITRGGLPVFLLIVVWAGMSGAWVWGWTYKDALATKDAELKRAIDDHSAEVGRMKASHDAEVARLLAEKADLWNMLKLTTGLLDRSTEVAARAAHLVAEVTPVAPRQIG